MKRHHIERLLRNFDLGTQIVFEHNLEQWREVIGLPLGYAGSGDRSNQNLHIYPSSPSPSSSGSRTPTSRFAPYEKCSLEENTVSKIHLDNILNESSRGIVLVEYHN